MLNKRKLGAAESEIVAEWYEKYKLIIFKTACKSLHNEDKANDVLQETFLRVMNHFDKLNNINEYQRNVYIKKILNSVISDYFRKEEKIIYCDEIYETAGECNLCDTTADKILLEEGLEILIKNMEKLSDVDKTLIQCKYFFQMDRKEISEIVEIPIEYVSLYVGRARKRLLKVTGMVTSK